MKTLLTAAIAGFAFATIIASSQAALTNNTAGLSGAASNATVTVVAVELPAR
jgi:hypothetical protein